MSNVVFILGAGASRQCGAPLMADFLDIASDLYRSGKVADSQSQFERVFSTIGALQAVHSKAQLDLSNIESVFTALELGRIIQRIPGVPDADIGETIAALKALIVKTLERTILFPVKGRRICPPKPYGEFADLLLYLRNDAFPAQTVSVITFNYDVAIDLAMMQNGLGPEYRIGPTPPTRVPVDLLKLHGSLNWATDKATNGIKPLHLVDYFSVYSLPLGFEQPEIALPIGTQLEQVFRNHIANKCDVESEPVIVPPSWNKTDYHKALSDVWAAAAQHLSEAESIYIIGYSLPETDSFFRHLFALGSVGKSTLRRIQVFNPDESGAIDARFRSLLGPGAIARYSYHPSPFSKAIEEIRKCFPKRS